MKKIMSLMLGLALVVGTTAVFAADDKPADGKMEKKKKGGKKKKGDEKAPDAPKA